jgi:cell wall-associated NlpC family hydrolase
MADAQAIQAKANKMVKQYKQLSNSLSAKAKKLAQQEAERLLNPPSDSSSQAPKDSNSSDDPVKNPPAPSRSNGMYSSIVAAAYSRLGCPYVSAGNGPAVFDCSGLVRWSYIHAHWYWPDGVRSVAQIRGYALPKGYAHPLSDAQPGDILLLYNSNPYHHHVAIYIGGGKYIQAPEPTKDVEISSWNITRFQYAIRWPKRG